MSPAPRPEPFPTLPPGAVGLRILATSDLHMHLRAHDYATDLSDPARGLTRVAGLIALARAEAAEAGAGVLLVDNGDGMQGTALGDVAAASGRTPLMTAFSHLRYDAAGLGNHDFNYGLDVLAANAAAAPCPLLCANLQARQGAPLPVRTHHVVAVAGLRVGLFSVLPPQTLDWDADHLAGLVTVRDIVPAARDAAAALRRDGAQVVVALCHAGLDAGDARSGQENAAIPLAGLAGIDVVIAGHTHLTLPGPAHAGLPHTDAEAGTIHGKPAVMPGSGGSHLGQVDLVLEKRGSGDWHIARHRSLLRPIARRDGQTVTPLLAEDADLVAALAADHRQARQEMARPVGRVGFPLHSYFTALGIDAGQALIAAAQRRAAAPHSPDGLPLLSAVAPGKSGGRAGPGAYTDIAAGPIRERHLHDLQPYPNRLALVRIDGQGLREWLEMSASLYRQVPPGSVALPLLDPDFAGHACDTIHGLGYGIDLSRPPRYGPDGAVRGPAGRIRGLSHAGHPVRARDEFAVTVNTYRLHGGGNVAALARAVPIPLPRVALRDALRALIARGAPSPAAPSPWQFLPMARTTVSLRTGPGAAGYLDALGAGLVAVSAPDDAGFISVTLDLARLANPAPPAYIHPREVGAGERLANPVRSGRKQP